MEAFCEELSSGREIQRIHKTMRSWKGKISFVTTVFFESILCVEKKVTAKHEMNVEINE